MSSTAGAGRTRRSVAVLAVVAIALMIVGLGDAADAVTDYLGSGTFVACGFAVSVTPPPDCPTVEDALAAAQQYGAQTGSAVVVELLPGDFCPFTVTDLASYRDVSIVGVGLAGIVPPAGTPTALTGPEAGLTTIVDDPAHCGSWPQALSLDGFGTYQTVSLRNVVLDAGLGAAPVGIRAHVGPSGAHLFLRDVETTGFSQSGLAFTGENLSVENSAFVKGGTGISATGATLSVTSTAVADDVHGMALTNVDAALLNDTIVHNTVDGVSIGNFGNTVTATNDVVAGNGAITLDDGSTDYVGDCTGTVVGDFVTTGGGHNLLGASCRPVAAAGDVLTSTEPRDLDTSGGAPTDFVPVPPEAAGIGSAAFCPVTDQREGLRDLSASVCDAGAVQRSAVLTPILHAEPAVLDLGTAPAGETVSGSFVLSQAGGGELGVFSVVAGAGVTVPAAEDRCTRAVLVPAASASSCAFTASMTAPAAGTTTGGIVTVTYDFGATLVLHVQAAGAPSAAPPAAPTGVTAVAGNAAATVRWSQPAGGTAATSWEVQRSSDRGAHWTAGGTSTTSSRTVTGLTNGTAYVFRVRAVDAAADAGPWSTVSAAVTPVADASRLTGPASTTVAYGHAVTLRGTLTDAVSHAALAGATVQLLSRTTGSWHVATSAVTGAAGAVSFSRKPTGSTQYELRYAGTTTHRGVTSTAATVHVHAVVHATAAPARVHHAHTLRVYGTLSPAGSGTTVKLQRLVHGTWRTVASAKVKHQRLPNGHTATGYVLSYQPAVAGTLSLRVVQKATTTLTSGSSSTLRVKVV